MSVQWLLYDFHSSKKHKKLFWRLLVNTQKLRFGTRWGRGNDERTLMFGWSVSLNGQTGQRSRESVSRWVYALNQAVEWKLPTVCLHSLHDDQLSEGFRISLIRSAGWTWTLRGQNLELSSAWVQWSQSVFERAFGEMSETMSVVNRSSRYFSLQHKIHQ